LQFSPSTTMIATCSFCFNVKKPTSLPTRLICVWYQSYNVQVYGFGCWI
jgi:hypothetical protein